MTLTGAALRMMVFISEDDQYHHRPLYTEIVHRAHTAGLAGATVVRGHEGFGASSHIHTTRILSLSEDLPAVVLIVDEADKIRAFVPEIEPLVQHGLITLEAVQVVHYVGARQADHPGHDAADTATGDQHPPRTHGWRPGHQR